MSPSAKKAQIEESEEEHLLGEAQKRARTQFQTKGINTRLDYSPVFGKFALDAGNNGPLLLVGHNELMDYK